MFHQIVISLLIVFTLTPQGLIRSQAQSPEVPAGWEKAAACQIRFLVPKELKNQYARGIDSCYAEFRSGKMRLSIDSSSLGGSGFTRTETMLDFVEEAVIIDGKKVRVITYKDGQTKSKRKFLANLFLVLHEGQSRDRDPTIFLYMTIQGNSEKEIGIAKQIFKSIQFDVYRPFSIEW